MCLCLQLLQRKIWTTKPHNGVLFFQCCHVLSPCWFAEIRLAEHWYVWHCLTLLAGMFDQKILASEFQQRAFLHISASSAAEFLPVPWGDASVDVMHMPSGPPCSLSRKMLEFAATATRITRITRTEAQCFSISTLNKMVLNYLKKILNGLKLWWRYTRHSKTKLEIDIFENLRNLWYLGSFDHLGRLTHHVWCCFCRLPNEVMPLHLCRSGARSIALVRCLEQLKSSMNQG